MNMHFRGRAIAAIVAVVFVVTAAPAGASNGFISCRSSERVATTSSWPGSGGNVHIHNFRGISVFLGASFGTKTVLWNGLGQSGNWSTNLPGYASCY